MLAKCAVFLSFASLLTLLICISASPPSTWSQGSRRPGYWTRPGQRPSSHDHDDPYKPDYTQRPGYPPHRPGYPHRPDYPQRPGYPHRPDYPQRPGYPHRPDYPQRPGYPDTHDVYPNDDCKYGRPCRDSEDDDYDSTGVDTDHDAGGYDDYDSGGQSRHLGCSCLLYVEYTVVFRRVNRAQRFSCNRYGLERCSRYCDELFQGEGLRASSRQDACDVLGREVHTPWYRKDQVCGSSGPYQDTPLETYLCCRRGRPSVTCSEE